MKPKGWRNDSREHAMARKGIRTRTELQREEIIKEKELKKLRRKKHINTSKKLLLEYAPDSIRTLINEIKPNSDEWYGIDMEIPHNEPLLFETIDGKMIKPDTEFLWTGFTRKIDKPIVARTLRTELVKAILVLMENGIQKEQLGIKKIIIPKKFTSDWFDGRIIIETKDGKTFKTWSHMRAGMIYRRFNKLI